MYDDVLAYILLSMKRPHSAKPVRNFMVQHHDLVIFEEPPKHFIKVGKKQMFNALSASNDLSRMLPKKILHDKERLYCETLQLKTNLNQIIQENLRLKTKVATLQKEKDRLQEEQVSGGKRKNSNLINLSSKNEKQNAIVSNLKKMVRQARQTNQNLNHQISKIKRAIRYTKINEVQLQKQTIYEQNKRLAKFVENLTSELQVRVRQEEQVSNLQNQLNDKIRELKEVTSDNIRYEQILEQLQMKNRQCAEKLMLQEKKWQRDISTQKHKVQQLNKQVEQLKYEIKMLKEKAQQEKKANNQSKRTIRPASNRQNAPLKNNKQKQQALKMNEKLKQQVQAAKRQLVQFQARLTDSKESGPLRLELQTKNQPFSLVLTKNQLNQLMRSKQEEQYQSFEQSAKRANLNELPLEQKQLVKEQVRKSDTSKAEMMKQIKQILTLRMKYNRYPFQQLKQDIQASPITTFSFEDLINMLMAQPFYLTKHYVQQFLKICFGKEKIKIDEKLPTKKLLQNLRLVIDDFQSLQDEEEERELYRIAQVLTRQRTQIEARLKERSKDNCVNKNELVSTLKKYTHLREQQISLAICYISINIQTLNAINYSQFLDRFYIKESRQLQNPLHNESNLAKSQQFSMGQKEDLSEGELIGDDQLV